MEDPEPVPTRNEREDKDKDEDKDAEEEERLRMEAEMERMMLAQEEEDDNLAHHHHDHHHHFAGHDAQQPQDVNGIPPDQLGGAGVRDDPYVSTMNRPRLTYMQASFGAAVALIWYALRTRQQWYLALVFLGSSKWAYIVLGNALIALSIFIFRFITKQVLGGLRLVESEGLADFFRWNVTDTCLALTMFRNDLDVESAVLFLCLVLGKCLHWIVETREGHLRMTQDAVVPWNGVPVIHSAHIRLIVLLGMLVMADIVSVVYCAQDILARGMSVHLLFGFEAAILLVTAMSLMMLWGVHLVDGILHYIHDETTARIPGIIHAWRERKATLIFAIEVQAQGAKFFFYCTFFGIVLNFYGLPLNLFREVYMSFQNLRGRLTAFLTYRRLMASLNRFPSVTSEEELDEAGRICIICRDEMTLRDCKKLPGCGHVFHKSCLREWLVQQQTCPTCRGDIVANESRERQRVQQERDRQEAAGEANGEAQAAAAGGGVARGLDGNAAPQPPGEQQQQQQRRVTREELRKLMFGERSAPAHAADRRDPMTRLAEAEGIVNTENNERTNTTTGTKSQSTARSALSFPALYKVNTSSEFVLDWEDRNIMRFLEQNTVVLCYEEEAKRELDGSVTSMLRIPDGWIRADATERLVSLP